MFVKLRAKLIETLDDLAFRTAVRFAMSDVPWLDEYGAERLVIAGAGLDNQGKLFPIPERIQLKHRDYIAERRKVGGRRDLLDLAAKDSVPLGDPGG
jgi:hypothetical protein